MTRDKPIVPVRFTPSVAHGMRVLADRDGMSVSAWVRQLVDREIGRREGKCPACGHEITQPGGNQHERSC